MVFKSPMLFFFGPLQCKLITHINTATNFSSAIGLMVYTFLIPLENKPASVTHQPLTHHDFKRHDLYDHLEWAISFTVLNYELGESVSE